MFQFILIAIFFGGSAAYLGRLIYRSFQAKNACESGCGKCSAVDLKKIESELRAKGL